MAATAKSGPDFTWGDLLYITAPPQGSPLPNYNPDTGPNGAAYGDSFLDIRYTYNKDKVTGYTGTVPVHFIGDLIGLSDGIPAAHVTNNIAGVQHAVTSTPLTLAGASVGVDINIPISPLNSTGYGNSLNGAAVVTAAQVLDFGFAFGNCTASSATIVVADSTQFIVGMPLVIAEVGNAGGTAALLTQVSGLTDATHITVIASAVPLATNAAAPIGAGNLWGPSELGYPLPTAHLPYLSKGPAIMLDPRQAIARGVVITGVGGSAGGNFIVSGWDVFWQPMTETIAAAAGGAAVYGKKAFKAIASVIPQFTDATNYEVGTSDVFGYNMRVGQWERTKDSWAGTLMTSTQGFVASTTAALGDVRGTLQTSAIGGGTGIGATASNGTVSALALTGNRLYMSLHLTPNQIMQSSVVNPSQLYGALQT